MGKNNHFDHRTVSIVVLVDMANEFILTENWNTSA